MGKPGFGLPRLASRMLRGFEPSSRSARTFEAYVQSVEMFGQYRNMTAEYERLKDEIPGAFGGHSSARLRLFLRVNYSDARGARQAAWFELNPQENFLQGPDLARPMKETEVDPLDLEIAFTSLGARLEDLTAAGLVRKWPTFHKFKLPP